MPETGFLGADAIPEEWQSKEQTFSYKAELSKITRMLNRSCLSFREGVVAA
jgi:hypothetical protein